MPGVTKRKFDGESLQICKKLKRPLYFVAGTLYPNYTSQELLKAFIHFYPLEWNMLVERCQLAVKKDMFLQKCGKKVRYKQISPENFFLNMPITKYLISRGYLRKHQEEYREEIRKMNFSRLETQSQIKLEKHRGKIAEYKKNMQTIDPYYLEALIYTYHKKGNTIDDKMEIVRECQKFDSERICEFFYKLNDSERNDQIRNIAFHHLQNCGHYVRLRKKFAGKQKVYMTEETDFYVTPADLARRLTEDSIQCQKTFDVFISHSYKDEPIIRKLINILNKYDLHCYCDWVSDNDFLKRKLASDYTKEVLKKRIEQSQRILFVQTENSMNGSEILSDWIQMELDYSKTIGKKIYSLILSTHPAPPLFKQISIDFESETLTWEQI